MNIVKVLLSVCFLIFSLIVNAQTRFTEGVDYKVIDVPRKSADGKIEVVEFFRYDCPACNSFEPTLNRWKEKRQSSTDVKLNFIPAIFGSSHMVLAKAYYAAETLGVLEKAHAAIFDGIHRQKLPFKTAEDLAGIVAAKGINRKQFLDAMNAFDADAKARRARKSAATHQVPSIPSIAVNGRYLVTGGMARGFDRLLEITDYLIDLERARLKKK